MKAFENTTREFLELLSSLDQTALDACPPDGGWTAGQIGEHVLKSYASVDVLTGNTKATDREADQKVAQIRELFLDFNIKMDSPKAILPSPGSVSKEWLIRGLEERISQMAAVIAAVDLSRTCVDYAIPEYGEFTRLEWLWFTVFHTQRHIHQLKSGMTQATQTG